MEPPSVAGGTAPAGDEDYADLPLLSEDSDTCDEPPPLLDDTGRTVHCPGGRYRRLLTAVAEPRAQRSTLRLIYADDPCPCSWAEAAAFMCSSMLSQVRWEPLASSRLSGAQMEQGR